MKNKTFIALVRIEIIILLMGNLILGIVNYFIAKQDLKLIEERQKKLKTQVIYKKCPYENENGRNEKE